MSFNRHANLFDEGTPSIPGSVRLFSVGCVLSSVACGSCEFSSLENLRDFQTRKLPISSQNIVILHEFSSTPELLSLSNVEDKLTHAFNRRLTMSSIADVKAPT